jgi:triphosphatase
MDPLEIELKFQVPAASRPALRRALATATARTVRLQAVYVDTADQRLAAAGLALRLRKQGRFWVQALKGRGDGLMQRLEHEVTLPPQRGVPVLDPARHAGTAVGATLMQLLADGTPLQERYRTDIRRLLRRVRSGGATVEVALDEGRIVAGGLSLPVCEAEFELVSGPPAALLDLAERWALRHGLWLDVRSKAERGHRLAQGLERVAATSATAAAWPAAATPGVVFCATLRAALAHLLPNAAEIASGDTTPAALHQLRVGLRRLRTALRVFAPWCADPAAARALERRWREPFQRLGAARDADVLAGWLPVALAAAGGPPVAGPGPRTAAAEPGPVVRDPAFAALVLQSLRLALVPPLPTTHKALAAAAGSVLRPAWRRLLADVPTFADATPEAQHRTRRRLKRLRYAVEFLLPLLPRKPARAALAEMRAALDALGAYNDLLFAESRLRDDPDAASPGAWFARGWLAATRTVLQRRAARRLRGLLDTSRFWFRGFPSPGLSARKGPIVRKP